MSIVERLAALETRITWLEKLAKATEAQNNRTALDSFKAEMRKRGPELRPAAARLVAKVQAAVSKLDSVLAKCARQDRLTHTPPRMRESP